MAEASSAIFIDPGTTAAMSGVAAAASAARHRRMLVAYFGRKDIDLPSNPPIPSFRTTSYMNHLRGPPSPLRYPSFDHGGVGVHIHYQGHCPHGPPSSYHNNNYFVPSHNGGNDPYFYPPTHDSSPYSYDAEYPGSPCGCSQYYWRDFLTTDIEKYKTACQQLRETYIWNLRELYYVGRVREVYDNHCRHHRLLFHDVCLAWETPEKVTLREESIGTTLSRHSSGSLRSPISPSSTPFLRGDSDSAETRVANKGKGKEVIRGPNVEIITPASSADDDKDERGKDKSNIKEETEISPTTTPVIEPQIKPNKFPMQRRLRQLWPTRVRGRSSDKAELAQLVRKDSDKHEGDEQESAV
ncbi:hypothetical protein F4860DRAFT_511577 [Xylaria cubensis]|nr:hypothetical protein F4860DRAFT_511577 [Xylaria cubensis]